MAVWPCLVNFSVPSKDSPGILAEVINERPGGGRRNTVKERKILGVLFVPHDLQLWIRFVITVQKWGSCTFHCYYGMLQWDGSVNGCNANAVILLQYKGTVIRLIPPLMFVTKRVFASKSGALNVKYDMNDPMAEENHATLIPIERANGRFLFVAAEDDQN
ncbi:unnamed protein product [Coregonus sp. 'balchen']|nr:unnamed protein product [Coregonus sp. 'balchen']